MEPDEVRRMSRLGIRLKRQIMTDMRKSGQEDIYREQMKSEGSKAIRAGYEESWQVVVRFLPLSISHDHRQAL